MRRNVRNSKVIRAIAIGLATMIAATSIPLNVFADNGDGSEEITQQSSDTSDIDAVESKVDAAESAAKELSNSNYQEITQSNEATQESVEEVSGLGIAIPPENEEERDDNKIYVGEAEYDLIFGSVKEDGSRSGGITDKAAALNEQMTIVNAGINEENPEQTGAAGNIALADNDLKSIQTALDNAGQVVSNAQKEDGAIDRISDLAEDMVEEDNRISNENLLDEYSKANSAATDAIESIENAGTAEEVDNIIKDVEDKAEAAREDYNKKKETVDRINNNIAKVEEDLSKAEVAYADAVKNLESDRKNAEAELKKASDQLDKLNCYAQELYKQAELAEAEAQRAKRKADEAVAIELGAKQKALSEAKKALETADNDAKEAEKKIGLTDDDFRSDDLGLAKAKMILSGAEVVSGLAGKELGLTDEQMDADDRGLVEAQNKLHAADLTLREMKYGLSNSEFEVVRGFVATIYKMRYNHDFDALHYTLDKDEEYADERINEAKEYGKEKGLTDEQVDSIYSLNALAEEYYEKSSRIYYSSKSRRVIYEDGLMDNIKEIEAHRDTAQALLGVGLYAELNENKCNGSIAENLIRYAVLRDNCIVWGQEKYPYILDPTFFPNVEGNLKILQEENSKLIHVTYILHDNKTDKKTPVEKTYEFIAYDSNGNKVSSPIQKTAYITVFDKETGEEYISELGFEEEYDNFMGDKELYEKYQGYDLEQELYKAASYQGISHSDCCSLYKKTFFAQSLKKLVDDSKARLDQYEQVEKNVNLIKKANDADNAVDKITKAIEAKEVYDKAGALVDDLTATIELNDNKYNEKAGVIASIKSNADDQAKKVLKCKEEVDRINALIGAINFGLVQQSSDLEKAREQLSGLYARLEEAQDTLEQTEESKSELDAILSQLAENVTARKEQIVIAEEEAKKMAEEEARKKAEEEAREKSEEKVGNKDSTEEKEPAGQPTIAPETVAPSTDYPKPAESVTDAHIEPVVITASDDKEVFAAELESKVETVIQQINSLNETGMHDQAKAVADSGIKVSIQDNTTFDEKISQTLEKAIVSGVPVSFDTVLDGISYTIEIPANAAIKLSDFIDSTGHLDIMRLIKALGRSQVKTSKVIAKGNIKSKASTTKSGSAPKKLVRIDNPKTPLADKPFEESTGTRWAWLLGFGAAGAGVITFGTNRKRVHAKRDNK